MLSTEHLELDTAMAWLYLVTSANPTFGWVSGDFGEGGS